MTRRIPRTKGALSGLIIIILGAWGALIPFIGPYFDYALHSDQTWQWFADRFWLEVLPGIVAVIGGFMLLSGTRRGGMSLGAMLALAAGLWFIVGPQVSTLWNDGQMTIGPAVAKHNFSRMLEWIGFHYGLGGLITMFSSYALGFIAALPIVDERVVGRTVAAGAGAGAGFAAGRATAPARTDEPAPATRETTPAPAAGDEAVPAGRDADGDGVPDRDETATGTAPRRRRGRFFRRRRTTTRT
jgi:hypothetical protein